MRLTRRLIIVFVVAAVIATVANLVLIFTGHQDAPLVGADWVGYWLVFAVVADFVIIYGAKWLGALLVERDHKEEQEQDGDE